MEQGGREDGVEKRERELREADAAARLAAEERENEHASAFLRLSDTLRAHLAQETQFPLEIVVGDDGGWRFLEAIIHVENADGLWNRTIFTSGVQRAFPSDQPNLPISYFLNPTWNPDEPKPVGGVQIEAIRYGTLGEVVDAAVRVAVEAMARERFSGRKILSWKEAQRSAREREERERIVRANRRGLVTTKKSVGCWSILGWGLGLLLAFAFLRSLFR